MLPDVKSARDLWLSAWALQAGLERLNVLPLAATDSDDDDPAPSSCAAQRAHKPAPDGWSQLRRTWYSKVSSSTWKKTARSRV
jgi:hypothetical protein